MDKWTRLTEKLLHLKVKEKIVKIKKGSVFMVNYFMNSPQMNDSPCWLIGVFCLCRRLSTLRWLLVKFHSTRGNNSFSRLVSFHIGIGLHSGWQPIALLLLAVRTDKSAKMIIPKMMTRIMARKTTAFCLQRIFSRNLGQRGGDILTRRISKPVKRFTQC